MLLFVVAAVQEVGGECGGRMDGSSSSIVWMGGSCVEVVCPDRCLGFAMSERRLSAIEDMILREMEESCEVVDLLSSPCLASFRCYLLVSMPGCLRLRFSSLWQQWQLFARSRPVCPPSRRCAKCSPPPSGIGWVPAVL